MRIQLILLIIIFTFHKTVEMEQYLINNTSQKNLLLKFVIEQAKTITNPHKSKQIRFGLNYSSTNKFLQELSIAVRQRMSQFIKITGGRMLNMDVVQSTNIQQYDHYLNQSPLLKIIVTTQAKLENGKCNFKLKGICIPSLQTKVQLFLRELLKQKKQNNPINYNLIDSASKSIKEISQELDIYHEILSCFDKNFSEVRTYFQDNIHQLLINVEKIESKNYPQGYIRKPQFDLMTIPFMRNHCFFIEIQTLIGSFTKNDQQANLQICKNRLLNFPQLFKNDELDTLGFQFLFLLKRCQLYLEYRAMRRFIYQNENPQLKQIIKQWEKNQDGSFIINQFLFNNLNQLLKQFLLTFNKYFDKDAQNQPIKSIQQIAKKNNYDLGNQLCIQWSDVQGLSKYSWNSILESLIHYIATGLFQYNKKENIFGLDKLCEVHLRIESILKDTNKLIKDANFPKMSKYYNEMIIKNIIIDIEKVRFFKELAIESQQRLVILLINLYLIIKKLILSGELGENESRIITAIIQKLNEFKQEIERKSQNPICRKGQYIRPAFTETKLEKIMQQVTSEEKIDQLQNYLQSNCEKLIYVNEQFELSELITVILFLERC